MTRRSDEETALQLAMLQQRRDAHQMGAMVDGHAYPDWSDIDPIAQQQYVADAEFLIKAMRVLGWIPGA